MTITAEEPIARTRKQWKQVDLAELITIFQKYGESGVRSHYADGGPDAVKKLIDLNLLAKPQKIELQVDTKEQIDTFISDLLMLDQQQRLLAARHCINAIHQAIIAPQRAQRNEAAAAAGAPKRKGVAPKE